MPGIWNGLIFLTINYLDKWNRMAKKNKYELFPTTVKIRDERRDSKNTLAFTRDDPEMTVGGRKMKNYLRFAIAYWHSFCGDGTDISGAETRDYPYEGLEGDDRIKVNLNVEVNHATLTGYSFKHDLQIATAACMLASAGDHIS